MRPSDLRILSDNGEIEEQRKGGDSREDSEGKGGNGGIYFTS